MSDKGAILLFLSASGDSDEAIAYAVKRAKTEGKGLVAVYVIETDLANEVFDTFSDIGFIGDRPSAQLAKALMKEYRQRGYDELGRVQIKAMEEGVDFDPHLEQGEFKTVVRDSAEHFNPSAVVVIRRARGGIMKYFSGPPEDDIKKVVTCEAVVFEAK